jgi:hypothetical protein
MENREEGQAPVPADVGRKQIQVGDFVTWRSAENPNALGFTGCQVLELGESEDGQPAARLNLGRFGVANALIADLVKEYGS